MQTINTSGGTLFHLAASLLNDATQWIRIAQANNISDPFLQGVVTLKIPTPAANAGGGLPSEN